MIIAIPKENDFLEKRVPLVPETVSRLVKMGGSVLVERNLGAGCFINDEQYRGAGAEIIEDHRDLLKRGDLIVRFFKPSMEEGSCLKEGALYIGCLDPFRSPEHLQLLAKRGVSSISLDLLPRSTRAQKMDVLSSQASLAGYVAVILAANSIPKILPMMTTPSGTIPPARFFVIGAGVAGLQAIATAKRLGACVEAFDVRPSVEEQVRSVGGKFLKIDLGETGETTQGYARELAPEQLHKQREGIRKACVHSDVVITTAQIFGKKAPVIVTRDILKEMKRGSVVIDLAVESGGNVEGVETDKEVDVEGVRVIGFKNLSARAAFDASRMYSNNIYNLIEEFWDKEKGAFHINLDDDIIRACLVTHQGKIVNERVL